MISRSRGIDVYRHAPNITPSAIEPSCVYGNPLAGARGSVLCHDFEGVVLAPLVRAAIGLRIGGQESGFLGTVEVTTGGGLRAVPAVE